MTRYNFRNRLAKRLWTDHSDSDESAEPMTQQNTSVGRVNASSGFERTESHVTKQSAGERRAEVPRHVFSPHEGEPRSFNPFDLRQLAESETIRAVEGTILGDVDAVPWSIAPVTEDANPSQSVIDEAERALDDLNPNPETFDDINQMLARDLLEIGNCVATTTATIDSRRSEAIPMDAATFTAEWSDHRVLEGFWQYPQGDEAKWGEPIPFETDDVLWGTYNPTTKRGGFYGHSPVEQVERAINIMGGLVEKETAELEAGMPSGILGFPDEAFTQSDFENFQTYWENEVAGNQVKHPLANTEVEFSAFDMTYKELQILDRQQWYAKLVGAVFQVPMSETGLAIGEEMTRATDISQRERYKQKALQSVLGQLEDLWTYQYLHRWFSEDIKLKFDVGKDLMEKDTLSQIHDRQLKNGTRTINEIREEKGLDEVEWGDEPFSLAEYAKQSFPDPDTEPEVGEPMTPPGQNGNGQTPEQANQNALSEGLEQDQTPTQNGGDVAKGVSEHGDFRSGATWMPAGSLTTVTKATENEPADATELRPNVDAAESDVFLVTDDDVDELSQDLADIADEYISEVLNQLRGNQQFLRLGREADASRQGGMAVQKDQQVQKSIADLRQLIQDVIGVTFAEDVEQTLNEHKHAQVERGVETILERIEQSAVEAPGIDAEPLTDRVAETIQSRTMSVVQPVSQRLESDLRDVLTDAWNNGWTITQTEQAVESLSDVWTGQQTERLARDQLGRASKESRLESAKETSDSVGGWTKEWVDSSDHRVRESHEAMDGTTVGEDEAFTVDYTVNGGPPGVEESYPGASKWGIQCRCSQKFSPRGLADTSKRLSEPDAIVFDGEDGAERGVIAGVRVDDFEWLGTEHEATTDDPAYILGREAGGSAVVRNAEFTREPFGGKSPTKAELRELQGNVEKYAADVYDGVDDVLDPEEIAVAKANIPGVDDPETGFSSLPDGWDRSSVLKAWASLGGSFTSCATDMAGEIRSPERFCAAMKDEVLNSEEWRGD